MRRALILITLLLGGCLTSGALGERVLYRSSDGAEIPAYLTKPPGRGPFPAVLLIHGGVGGADLPLGEDELYWSQALLDSSYVVLSPNYRYDTLGGERELADVLAALGYLRGLEYVDRDRLAILGCSRGGYLTLRALAEGKGLRAGVAQSPITDLGPLLEYAEGKALPPDIKKDVEETIAEVGRPRDNPEGYRARSPIYAVDRMRGPILVIQSEGDVLVPINQSRRFVEVAREAGLSVEYKVYPGEGHCYGPNSGAPGWVKEDALERTVEFLDGWVKE